MTTGNALCRDIVCGEPCWELAEELPEHGH